MTLITNEPLQVAYDERADMWPYGWLVSEQAPMEMEQSKTKAISKAKKKAQELGLPGVVIHTKANDFHRFWVNERYFKNGGRWIDALAEMTPGGVVNLSDESGSEIVRRIRTR